MKYNLKDEVERKQAIAKMKKLLDDGKRIELKEIRSIRTLKQNAYLHKVFTLLAIDWGWTPDEMKTYLKRECPFMRYQRKHEDGKESWFLKRTSELDKTEMAQFIDWIFNWAGMQGVHIPTSEEYLENQEKYESIISRHQQWS